MDNKENFKHLLEYFVAHLEYVNGSPNPQGKNMYIDPLLQNDFKRTGCGYDNDAIQEQISSWDKYDGRRIGITIQANFGSYTSKKCYLNWVDTGINIFAEWKENKVNSLYIGHCYWWLKNQAKRYSDKLLEKKTTELGLFNNDSVSTDLNTFYDYFINEIIDYDNKRGVYYMREKEDNKEDDSEDYGSSGKMIQYKKFLNSNYNLILTGAPGTGKTYLAKQIAQQLIFGEVKKEMTDEEKKQFNEQCGFVQFHPSYDYTDFVEGLRPVKSEDENGVFERKDGCFKAFCKKAIVYQRTNVSDNFDEAWEKLVDYLNDNDFIDIPFLSDKSKAFRTELNEYGTGLASRTYQNDNYQKGEWIKGQSKFFSKDQLYNVYKGLSGVPSGGHDNYRKAVIEKMKESFNLIDYKAGSISSGDKKPFVFIIDEINRGEISKIFGELFFSIDPGYRGIEGKVKTQYQNLIKEDDDFYEGFYVPENVYIIGTMNDIDRSVESMDFAFRRRFAFKEVTAEDSQEMLDSETAWKDSKGNSLKPDDETIKFIKGKMESLNKMIWHKGKEDEKEEDKCIEGLSSAYHIGASYFLKLKNYRNDDGNYDFDKLWEYHLEGLLYEYLRGTTDLSHKMKGLATAYGYTNSNKYE